VKVTDLTFHYEGPGDRARVTQVALFRQTDCTPPGSGDPCLGTGQFSGDGTITFTGLDEKLSPGETRCYSLRYSLTALESDVTYKAKMSLDDMVADLDPPGEPLRIGGNTVKGSVKPPPPPQVPKSGEVQDPIDTGTGSYFFSTIDLSLGGPMPLFFSRSYASIKNKEAFFWSYLGDRWRHNHYIRLNEIDDTHVEIHLQNDQKLDFEKQASEWHLVPEQDIHYQYQQGAEGGHYLLDPDKERVYIFDDQAWLTHVMDRNGNRHTYLRDDEDRIVEISDGLGRAFVVSYDDPDRSWRFKEVAIQGTGAKIRFEYDEYDRLIRFTDPEGHVTGYTYDDDRSTGSSLITRVTPGRGNAPYAQVYDTDGGRVQQQIDAYDNATDLVYDINGRTTITYPDGTVQEHAHRFGSLLTEAVDPRNNPISLDHDLTGHITSMTSRTGETTQISYHEPSGKIDSMTNARDDVLSYTYTDQDQTFSDPDTQDSVTFTFYNLTRIDYPDGTFETFSHDGKGNILEHIDPAGNPWTYTYNDHGQVLTATNPEGGVTICTYNADATLASTTDSDTGTSLYVYDGYKRLTQITHPDNTIIQIAYDLSNQVTAVTDGRGNTHAYAYDANGNLASITDPDTRQTLFTRDLMDRVNETTNTRGKKSRHVYDHMNRLQSIIDPNANTVQYGYSDRGRLEKITDGSGYEWTTNFDNEGLPISDTTPMGRTTAIVRDSLGYITQIKNPLNEETLLTRDKMSRISRVTDPLDRITRYTYDHAGRLTGVTLPDGTAATYLRNGLGLVDRITDLKGSQWLLNYTAMGRLSTLTDPLNNQWQYGYDERGRLNQIIYPDGTTQTRTLDNADNLLRSRYSTGPDLNFTYDTQNRLLTADHIEFTYNETGQVTATTDSGTAFGATYDDGGRLETVTYNNGLFNVTYTHDARNLLTRVTDSLTGTAIDFSYDNDGLLTAVTRPGGADTSFTWDDASRLTRIQHGTLADLQYTYNAAGEVTGIDYDLPLDPADYQVTATENLNHDGASQIITPGHAFDDLGRQTDFSGQPFTWDGASRLTATSDAILIYNGLNNLLTRQKSGTTTHYFYNYALGLHPVVAEYNETTSTWKRFYVLTPDGTLLYAIDPASGNAVTFYHFDKGGNTLFLSNAAGAITDTYAYSPYGRLLAHEGTSDQPFTFGGAWGVRQENAEGLYQMRARYYHAATSRFISREPLWPQLHNAVALNNYQYADADPIQSIDPTGLSAQQKIKVGFSVSPDVKKSFYHEAVKGMTESVSIKKGGESLSNGSKYGVFQTEGEHTTEVDYSVIIKGSDNEVVAEIRNNLTGESMVAGALAVDYIKRGVPEGPGANPGEVTRNYGTNWILVNFAHQIQDELRNFLDLTSKTKDPVDTGGSDQVQEASAARHMGKGEAIEKLQKFTPVNQSSKRKSILKTDR
jgi:RHS repeat-associated protein